MISHPPRNFNCDFQSRRPNCRACVPRAVFSTLAERIPHSAPFLASIAMPLSPKTNRIEIFTPLLRIRLHLNVLSPVFVMKPIRFVSQKHMFLEILPPLWPHLLSAVRKCRCSSGRPALGRIEETVAPQCPS